MPQRNATCYATDESTYFLSVNRNKRSVAVDIKHPRGRELLLQLAQHCDAVVENFVPGKLDGMGLGYARPRITMRMHTLLCVMWRPCCRYKDFQAVNPGIVYCSITAFGPDGPDSHRTGYDVAVAAMGGLLSITGDADGPPAKVLYLMSV